MVKGVKNVIDYVDFIHATVCVEISHMMLEERKTNPNRTCNLFCHCRKCRRGRRSWHPGSPSRYNHHKVQNGDRPRQDKSDDKQPKWLPKTDQDKRSEARRSGEL